jgi:hypothetical protein
MIFVKLLIDGVLAIIGLSFATIMLFDVGKFGPMRSVIPRRSRLLLGALWLIAGCLEGASLAFHSLYGYASIPAVILAIIYAYYAKVRHSQR